MLGKQCRLGKFELLNISSTRGTRSPEGAACKCRCGKWLMSRCINDEALHQLEPAYAGVALLHTFTLPAAHVHSAQSVARR